MNEAEAAQAGSYPADAPVVVTYRSPVFNRSEGFVQAQALGLTKFQPVVCGRNFVGNVAPRLQDRVIMPDGLAEMLRLDLTGPSRRYVDKLAPWRPALVHAHFATDAMAGLALARRIDVPLVTSLRGFDLTRSNASMVLSGAPSKLRYTMLGRRLRRQGDLFLPVCDFLRQRALAKGYPAERTVTHYNGVDLAAFRPHNLPPEPGLVLHVGRLAEKKGTVVLLRAFALARREHPLARLVVIGDGPRLRALKDEAARLGITDAVTWLGAQPPSDVANWMQRALLLAAPSVTARGGNSEGLPNVVVEAAASGLPVVATRHGGIPEAVDDGRSGLLVPEYDVAALAAALSTALSSPRLREEFSRAGRAIAVERFDYRRQMERLEEHYLQTIAAYRRDSRGK